MGEQRERRVVGEQPISKRLVGPSRGRALRQVTIHSLVGYEFRRERIGEIAVREFLLAIWYQRICASEPTVGLGLTGHGRHALNTHMHAPAQAGEELEVLHC